MKLPTNINEARDNANALKRAIEALKDGSFVFWFQGDGIVTLDSWKPEGEKKYNRYTVDLNNETCSCPSFEHRRICKHLLATLLHVNAIEEEEAREATQCEEYEAKMATCEDEVHGCDPYAKY